MNINNNIIHVRQNLPVGVTLIAVSKTQPVEAIEQAYAGGQRVFGENKVQELVPKHEALPKDIQWHMIGHLQSNKVKYIAPFVHLIHGVDSAKLLEEINKQAVKAGRTLDCLLQVHIAEEETKFGFSPEEVTAFLESPGLSSLGNIRVMGLMGMATFTDNKEQIKREFGSLKTLFDRLKASSLPTHVRMQELSMGMSGDYALAIEQGSTMIRVGTAIFGSRHKTA
jgi:pyridoxal phosphate enzyme (YggS family)